MARRKLLTVAILAMLSSVLIFAQETEGDSLFDISEDDLFGGSDDDLIGESEDDLFGGEMIEDGEGGTDSGFEDLLTSDVPTLGGRFSASSTSVLDPENINELDDITTTYALGATLFLDARPDPDFRVFLKSDVDYQTDGSDPPATFRLEELFADLTVTDWLFLRTGKQNVTWGVGFFFSPADFLSLEAIDPEDPEAEREGPVAVRLQTPIQTSILNGYAILDDLPTANRVSWAGKFDFLAGNAEFTTGAAFQRDNFAGGMLTYSGSVGDFDLFAELVARLGSVITIVEEDGASLVPINRDDEWFPLGTAGGRYSWSDDQDRFSLSVVGQYLYNGEGYADPEILKDPRVLILLDPVLDGADDPDDIFTVADLTLTGRHYGAASVTWSDALGSDLSPSVFWIGNLSDGSGFLTVDLSWRFADSLSLTPGYTYTYGEEGEEFSFFGSSQSFSLTLGLGSGNF